MRFRREKKIIKERKNMNYSETDLYAMTIKDLKALPVYKTIKGRASLKDKAQIVEAIVKASATTNEVEVDVGDVPPPTPKKRAVSTMSLQQRVDMINKALAHALLVVPSEGRVV